MELSIMWWRDPRLRFGRSPVECYFPPARLGRATGFPSRVKILHLGDLRSPNTGVLTQQLEERVASLAKLYRHNRNLRGVVIHAESALGWEDGERDARREFWQLLAATFGEHPILIEDNILLAKGSRYEFVRDPNRLAEEVGEVGLRLALDTSHAAWFYGGWPTQIFDLLGDPRRVGHLHLSDWAPDGPRGRQHLPLGKGILPIEEIRRSYRGELVTIEVRSPKLGFLIH